MAKDFGIQPWRLDDEVPDEWVERWLADHEARLSATPKTVGGQTTSQQGNARRTRVI